MGLPDLTFPIVGLGDRRPGREAWEWFWDPEDFLICESWRLANRLGMLIADSDGRCWEVSSYRDMGITGGFWERVWRLLLRQGLHRLDQNLKALPSMTLDDVKSRFCAAIQNNPDYWRDDEAIAGEDGPPRNEQDLLDEMKAQVMRANSVPELISNLWGEDLSRISAHMGRGRTSSTSAPDFSGQRLGKSHPR